MRFCIYPFLNILTTRTWPENSVDLNQTVSLHCLLFLSQNFWHLIKNLNRKTMTLWYQKINIYHYAFNLVYTWLSYMDRAGKFYSSARHGEWKFSLTRKLFNLLVLKGEWKLLSENKEFMVCAVETGKSHIYKGIYFIWKHRNWFVKVSKTNA